MRAEARASADSRTGAERRFDAIGRVDAESDRSWSGLCEGKRVQTDGEGGKVLKSVITRTLEQSNSQGSLEDGRYGEGVHLMNRIHLRPQRSRWRLVLCSGANGEWNGTVQWLDGMTFWIELVKECSVALCGRKIFLRHGMR